MVVENDRLYERVDNESLHKIDVYREGTFTAAHTIGTSCEQSGIFFANIVPTSAFLR